MFHQKKLSEKEEKFQEYLFDMYKKGQLAAMFEREQEVRHTFLLFVVFKSTQEKREIVS